jgi:hypothetical protein
MFLGFGAFPRLFSGNAAPISTRPMRAGSNPARHRAVFDGKTTEKKFKRGYVSRNALKERKNYQIRKRTFGVDGLNATHTGQQCHGWDGYHDRS